MRVLLMTNEFPPEIYGGAGVHVQYLARELARLDQVAVEVRAFGRQDEARDGWRVKGYPVDASAYTAPDTLRGVLTALQRGVDFNADAIDADVVHVHTWYSHFAGITAKLCYGIPLVLTTHSLEPLRPWKREQLGGGYDFSCWIEKTAIEMADAVIAVSNETRDDVLRLFDVDPAKVHVVYNGIDPEEYQHRPDAARLRAHGVDPDQPYVLFVGRITRQKGIVHLVNAIRHLDPGFQIVLCAGAPDTPEIAAEMKAAVDKARESRDGVVWIDTMVDDPTKIALYSGASVFCCPSIYEPFGIINLEAMACGTPVVASAVGGIKEVVVHEGTGLLVPVEQMNVAPFEPVDPAGFAADLAAGINRLMADEAARARMAEAGRQRVLDHFSWSAIAARTADLYRSLTEPE